MVRKVLTIIPNPALTDPFQPQRYLLYLGVICSGSAGNHAHCYPPVGTRCFSSSNQLFQSAPQRRYCTATVTVLEGTPLMVSIRGTAGPEETSWETSTFT